MFQASTLDTNHSPQTGWIRDTWLEAGEWILCQAIRALPDPNGPMVWPRQSKILYPQPGSPAHRYRAADFEGLARTLLIAAPVLNERDIVIDGINLREWYRQRLTCAVNPASNAYVGPGEGLHPDASVQQQVEGASLAICLWAGKNWLWSELSAETREQVLDLFEDLGYRQTHGHNWRFFNVLMLSFAHQHGREIRLEVIQHHLQQLLAWSTGDGYYRDGAHFDYYGAWAFQVYAPLWIKFYGSGNMPAFADALARNLPAFIDGYHAFFARDGRQIVWGRSSTYRAATAAPLAAAGMVTDLQADWGYFRRLCSGNLARFLKDETAWEHGIPSAGLHGVFEGMLQPYSCSGSPYWFGKIFVACMLPPDHPFWTAAEHEGPWATSKTLRTHWWPGAGILNIARADGSSELLSTKIRETSKIVDPNYCCLSYHSHFPWTMADGQTLPGSLAMVPHKTGIAQYPTQRLCLGYQDGFVSSQLIFKDNHSVIDIMQRPTAQGMITVLRSRLNNDHSLQFCSYAVPNAQCENWGKGQLLHAADGRWLAMSADGFDLSPHRLPAEMHPEASPGCCLVASAKVQRYRHVEYYVIECQYGLHGETPEALLASTSSGPLGIAGPLTILLVNGESWQVDFGAIEGNLSV